MNHSSSNWRGSRREVLRLGTLAGLSAAGLGATPGPSVHPAFGRARSCLLVFLAGGPSHLDTFDPKPDAPAEVRGEFDSIATTVPGLRFCEHLPRLARRAHRFTVVRSMTHADSSHGCASYRMLTGRPYPRDAGLSEHLSREDHPHVGSIVAAATSPGERSVPPFVMVPGLIEARGPARAGQHAGRLGREFDPLVLPGGPHEIGPSWAFHAPPSRLPNLARRPSELDLERYGPGRFGRALLLGRRLVEAGVRLVQVNWDRRLEAGWDTHADAFAALRDDLLPPLDRALSALFDDMAACGLLDETLVVVLGEFGRGPRVNSGAGREHWPGAFSVLVAGAGLAPGRPFGATDREGASPVDRPTSPASLAATILFALGIDGRSPGDSADIALADQGDHHPVLGLWS